MIEITHGWRNVIAHSSTQQHLAGGTGREEGRQACHFSAVHPQKSKAVLDQKGWKPQIVPYIHHKWHADTIDDIDMVKAQDMGPEFYHSIMLLFIWETFQQSVLQSMKRISADRVTDCFTQTNNKRGSISPRMVLLATSSTKGRA